MVICTYEILIPQLLAADALPPAALTGAFEASPGDARLRLRDVLAAFPFEGRWHLRAQFSPPGEGHVFFDLLDPAAPVPLLPDGTAALRALPLGALVAGAPGARPPPAEWAWAPEDFAAWAAARRAAAAAAAAEAGGAPQRADAPPEEGWREDGELREGGAAAAKGLGAAGEAASAALNAAASAAASAAANAMGAVTSFFGGGRR